MEGANLRVRKVSKKSSLEVRMDFYLSALFQKTVRVEFNGEKKEFVRVEGMISAVYTLAQT
mgnify:CR=1 FL=1